MPRASEARAVQPTVGDLIDRLSILQLQTIFDPERRASFQEEMTAIESDLGDAFDGGARALDVTFIRLLVALGQINLHIWKTKEVMQADPDRFADKMKLAHQLNGIRNRLKNRVSAFGGHVSAVRTNVGTDQLEGWAMQVLDGDGMPSASPVSARQTTVPLADLIDALTVLQIKEVLLPPARTQIEKELPEVVRDIAALLAKQHIAEPRDVIRLVLFLAQANLIVWYHKEEMERASGEVYDRLLEHAQELNGLRNEARNALMSAFAEGSPARHHVTFLQYDTDRWYTGLVDRIASRVETLGEHDFARLFGTTVDDLPEESRVIARSRDFRFRRVTGQARDQLFLAIVKRIHSAQTWVSGEDQQHIWERGWAENLKEYESSGDTSRLTPKFVRSDRALRFRREYIQPLNPHFEFNAIDVYRHWLFRKYFSDVAAIYEFGCGSCQHFPVLAGLFPDKPLYGLDWAESSLKILERLHADQGWNIQARQFNLFEPDESWSLESRAGVFTMGTMEQLGTRFEPFLQYLLTQNPSIVIHCETIRELYDDNRWTDYLAVLHDSRRNYLDGYLTRLRQLEQEGRLAILAARRVELGNLFHDSYSLLAWVPRQASPETLR